MKATLTTLACLSLASSALASGCSDDWCCPDPCDENLFVHQCQAFVNAEFLYWTAEIGASDYAIKNTSATDLNITLARGDYKLADYEYRPGYRVSLAWYNCPKYWEAMAEYTWLYTRGSERAYSSIDEGRFVDATWDVLVPSLLEKASSRVSLHYHLGDLVAARVFDPNPHLRVRMIGGATVAHIDQTLKIRYTTIGDTAELIKSKWKFVGGGIRLGTTIDWFWGCQFYMTGKASIATLAGSYENKFSHTLQDATVVGDTTFCDTRLASHLQFMLGPSWQKVCPCWSAQLFAGYEFNTWFNLNEMNKTNRNFLGLAKVVNQSKSPLGLHGLTVRATVGF